MGYARLFKRVRLAPGVALNLSLHGPSVSFGVKGAHLTVGRSGIWRTVGFPGTGLFYTARDGWHTGIHSAAHFHDATPSPLSGNRTSGNVILVLLVVLAPLALAVTVAVVVLGS